MLKKCLRINTTKTTSAKMEAATGKNTWVRKKNYLGSEENIKRTKRLALDIMNLLSSIFKSKHIESLQNVCRNHFSVQFETVVSHKIPRRFHRLLSQKEITQFCQSQMAKSY